MRNVFRKHSPTKPPTSKSSAGTTPAKPKRARTKLDMLLTFVVLAGLSTSTALLLNEYDSVNSVKQAGSALALDSVSAETIADNKNADVNYDYSDIKPVTAENIEEAMQSANIFDLPVIGAIAMPEINLNLPIIKGVSDSGMFTGGTTLLADQQMGVGNYPIASHRSMYEDLLFGPIHKSEVGMKLYLSDLTTIYEYTVVSNEVVTPETIEVLDETETPTVTLITCTLDSKSRVIVRGELSNEWTVDKAPKDVLDALSIDPSNQFSDSFAE